MSKVNTVEYILFATPHYSFTAKRTARYDRNGNVMSYSYQVGDSKKPCLSLIIFEKEYYLINPNTNTSIAILNNIEGLDECNEKEVSENTYDTFSFANEELNVILQYIRDTYPHIKYISLTDASYIPCNRKLNDTLDLLTYSIALYGKTWYERHFNAYPTKEKDAKNYIRDIKYYTSEEFKNSLSFDEFMQKYLYNITDYAHQFIETHLNELEDRYNSSKTFPEFFLSIHTLIPRDKKCLFYKQWLEKFIGQHVQYQRDWTFELNPFVGGTRPKRKQTTRRSKVKK